MNIRIISPFFYPEPISSGKYNTHLSIALSMLGNAIKVICFHPFYPNWTIRPSTEVIDGIAIHRGGALITFPKSQLLRRILLEISFSLHVFMSGFKRHDIDVVILPPSLFALFSSSRFFPKARKRVAIIHDLQGVYLEKRDGAFSRIISKAVRAIEQKTLKQQTKVIFLSQEMRTKAINDYSLNPNLCHVHYPFSTYEANALPASALESVLPGGFLHITYSGALGEKQNPEGLVHILDRLRHEFQNVQCHIFSAGPIFQTLKKKYLHTGIHFHDLVAESDLAELYARSTLQIIPQLPGTSAGSMPSKLPNISHSGCKFLVITDAHSELEKVCKRIPNCITSTTWEFEKIRELLVTHLSSTPNTQVPQPNLFPLQPLIDEIIAE